VKERDDAWQRWDDQRCGAELASLKELQRMRSRGGDPRQWLIPDELVDAYRNDNLLHAIFDAAAAQVLSTERPPAACVSRDAVLTRAISLLVDDRKRMLAELSKQHALRPPSVLLSADDARELVKFPGST
jgi:hypothetical protein